MNFASARVVWGGWNVAMMLLAALASGCVAESDPAGGEGDVDGADAITQCPTSTVEGIDVANGNGAIQWNSVEGSGVAFSFIKATQGTYNTQADFTQNWSNAKANGVLRGAYHFFDPTEDGKAQAQHFLSVVGSDVGELPPALDLECPNGDSKCLGGPGAGNAPGSAITQRVHDFLNAVEEATGMKMVIYTFPAYFSGAGVSTTGLGAYPLWIASLNSCASVPAPWTSTKFWQYSWTGAIPGIGGQVDKDRFMGSEQDLLAFAMGTSNTPPNDCTTDGCPSGETCDATQSPPACVTPTTNNCQPITFPSGVSLVTVPDAELSAEYAALSGAPCAAPQCFIDTQNLVDTHGTKHDVHVDVGPHFELYELVQTEVDPNETGDVDPAHAYGTKVLVSPDLVNHLDTLRTKEGGPVTLTSGFRSPKHQQSICQEMCGKNQCTSGGTVTCSATSEHLYGEATDMALGYESLAKASGFGAVTHELSAAGTTHLHVEMTSCH